MPSTTVALVIDAVIGLAIIAAAVVLLALGDIDGTTAIAIIGAGAAYASGSTKSAIALQVPPAVKPPQPPQ